MVTCRLLPYAVADGPHNMAADEALLEAAAAGTATLRFYGWSEATLSLGYFQPEPRRRDDTRLAALPFVRRPSGGDALVHHHELTYALGVPEKGTGTFSAAEKVPVPFFWLQRMHLIVAAALADLDVTAALHVPPPQPPRFAGFLCFHHKTAGDLMVGPGKVVGSAQRRRRGALVQHGAILLAQSAHTPALPGIYELSERRLTAEQVRTAVQGRFVRETGWELIEEEATPDERRRIEELVAVKYGQDGWNRKR